jgi:hypothetical protein
MEVADTFQRENPVTITVDTATTTTRRPVRKAVFLPAVGLIVAAATQIDASITTNAFRSVTPAPEDSLNFPWYGELAGQISTWWSFTGLFLVIGSACFARCGALRHSRAGRAGAWAAVAGAALIVVANFMSAVNADAMMNDGISKVIVGLFAGATLLIGAGLIAAGLATLRSGTWHGVGRYVPIATGIWCFLLIPIQFTGALAIGVGMLAALQVALGATLIAEES